ncbi:hypothetical protein PP614_25000 [Mycobacteroides abscessus]|nr:hypothetical protein [Mycobacteroides abscessus]AMU53794.1 hypothetical protein A3O02_00135 [Mycobacteroides abscessus]MDM1896466.1 hypothetical protein [Mycobacteroides abscessus]MDM1903502.1 hypothetical protein [Mycobacteroides abscessus]MDM1907215.1 hypothetical protein [Mycobacteroides abscessus]MDM1910273.1 hypothetical protein [Mycobacteroides abscessus]
MQRFRLLLPGFHVGQEVVRISAAACRDFLRQAQVLRTAAPVDPLVVAEAPDRGCRTLERGDTPNTATALLERCDAGAVDDQEIRKIVVLDAIPRYVVNRQVGE